MFPFQQRRVRGLKSSPPRNDLVKSQDVTSFARSAKTLEPMGVASIQHCMRLLVAEVRLPQGTCPHTLRHSYATHLIEAGVSIRLLAKFMGHSSIETTAIYTHLTAVNERHACEAAARLLDNT
ncbi:MAG: hypothetical protein SynsKO_45830 [Synoicihabitans sp.]